MQKDLEKHCDYCRYYKDEYWGCGGTGNPEEVYCFEFQWSDIKLKKLYELQQNGKVYL